MIRNFGSSGVTNQPQGLDLGLGGSSIKSVQSGEWAFTTETSKAININSVNTTKSIVYLTSTSSGLLGSNTDAGAVLTNGTTLTLTRVGTSDAKVRWFVVEFNNVKSKQSGSLTHDGAGNGTEKTAAITIVDLSKSLLFFSFKSTTTTGAEKVAGKFVDASNLTFLKYTNGGTSNPVIEWQVLEFN